MVCGSRVSLPLHLLVVPIAGTLVEDPVDAFPVGASPVGGFPNEAGSLPPLTGRVETLPVPGTSASVYSPASLGLLVLLMVVVERAQ